MDEATDQKHGQGKLLRLHGRWVHEKPQETKWPESKQEVSFGSFATHFKKNFAIASERLAYLHGVSDTYNLLHRALVDSVINILIA